MPADQNTPPPHSSHPLQADANAAAQPPETAAEPLRTDEAAASESASSPAGDSTYHPTFRQRVAAFRQRRPALFRLLAFGLIPLLVLAYFIGSLFHANFLYGLAETAYRNGNCETAVELLVDYQERYDTTLEVYLLKTKSYLCLQQLDAARGTLATAQQNIEPAVIAESVAFWFYHGLLALAERDLLEGRKAVRNIKSINSASLSGYYLEAFVKLLDDERNTAVAALSQIVRNAAAATDAEAEQMQIARGILVTEDLFTLATVRPLPFSALAQQPAMRDALGFDLPLLGYHNGYHIPISSPAVADEELNPADHATLIKALILLDDDKAAGARGLLESDITNRVGLLYAYTAGYAEATLGNTTAAAKFYQTMSEADSDAALLYANATWSNSGGSAPAADTIAMLQGAADAGNAAAANNLAFFHIANDRLDDAGVLINAALTESPTFFASLANRILLDLAQETFSGSTADHLYALVRNAPAAANTAEVATLQQAVVQAFIGNWQYKQALEIVHFVQTREPANTDWYLTAARIYRALGQPDLVLRTLESAHKQFPSNPVLAGELLIAKAQFDPKNFAEYCESLELPKSFIRGEPRILAAIALAAETTARAREIFRTKMLRAIKTDADAVRGIELWTRYELTRGFTQRASGVLDTGNELIVDASRALDLLGLRVQSFGADTDADRDRIATELTTTYARFIHRGGATTKADAAWAYYQIGMPTAAIALVEKVQTKDALEALYLSYEAAGQTEQATAARQKFNTAL